MTGAEKAAVYRRMAAVIERDGHEQGGDGGQVDVGPCCIIHALNRVWKKRDAFEDDMILDLRGLARSQDFAFIIDWNDNVPTEKLLATLRHRADELEAV